MKKILFLTDVPLDNVGGAQQSMKIIMEGLKDEYSFYILTPATTDTLQNKVEMAEFRKFTLRGMGLFKVLKLFVRVSGEIKRIQPHLIHVQMPATMIIVGLLKLLKLIPENIKIIYTDRGVFNKYGKITKLLIKLLGRTFEKIICTTEFNYKLHKQVNDKSSKFEIIPNTAGFTFENYNRSKRESIRRRYNINPTQIVIGFAGRNTYDKNWPLAIEILKELNKYMKFTVNVSIGTIKTERSIEEANKIICEIRQVIGQERIIGSIDIPIDHMNNMYYLNDFFILTSRQESFGRTAVEAMARENIVLGTRVDGLNEVLHYEENKYSSVEELINKLLIFINDPVKSHMNKSKMYKRFTEYYSLEIYLKNHKRLYDEILYKIK